MTLIVANKSDIAIQLTPFEIPCLSHVGSSFCLALLIVSLWALDTLSAVLLLKLQVSKFGKKIISCHLTW
jgi:hypothetical protein